MLRSGLAAAAEAGPEDKRETLRLVEDCCLVTGWIRS
jgi:hypothetical protein